METQTVTIQVDQTTAEVVRALLAKAEMEGKSTEGLLAQLRETGEPLILTINGGEKVVMQEASSYQRLPEELDRADALECVRQGIEAMKTGRSMPVQEFLAELRGEFGFPESRPGIP
ncbi:MAG: hypothetical protein ACREEM_54930 [Blastocatellia bacterium]